MPIIALNNPYISGLITISSAFNKISPSNMNVPRR